VATQPNSNTPECSAPALTWSDLVELEPRLEILERDIKYHATQHQNGRYCASSAWHGYRAEGFKDRLSRLVGWGSERLSVRSSESYDLAYDRLYALLPNCTHESVFCA
jgi:hypothetical protein